MATPPFPGGHRPFPVDDAEVGQGAPAEFGKIPNLRLAFIFIAAIGRMDDVPF